MILIKSNQLFLNRIPKNRIQKFIYSPFSRIIIAILFLIPMLLVNNVITIFILDKMEEVIVLSTLKAFKAIIIIGLLIYSYRFYTKRIEKRPAFEFNFERWHIDLGWGIVIGGGMVIIITAVLFVLGYYTIDYINSWNILITRIFRYAQGSFIEELIFTVIIFRLLEEKLGTAISFLIVSLFFGGMHFINDNATIFTSLSISVIQITLIAPFILTRRIWMGWAVHFSWNFFQAGVFGMNNSGMDQGGFISPIITGPHWLTGGAFGIEASWLGLIVNIVVGISLLIYAIKFKQTIKFMNKRAN
ncbi:CPBP family intramembrane glutamic endopeptidase [Lentimicrobium sp. S6]|uniref:CPBP family intramembrane glutamic endopeptidase n=1 Tax=Lentimicrobium sp. S6 TaxID=2735872 RepID=UPI0015542118|nr:CPBP family intramembrane glutamic endopeptidase [Lentimicrobium sp. S6]NPD47359.1 CPBP family intramembrane metalloprotease [Lentimicrobium sp. S6]